MSPIKMLKMYGDNIKQILFLSILLPLLDYIYLHLISNYFTNQIETIQKKKMVIRYIPFVLCYVLLIFDLYFFVIRKRKPPLYAFLGGIVIYGVYELANYSLFQDWKLLTVIFDTLWGGVLSAAVTYLTYMVFPDK